MSALKASEHPWFGGPNAAKMLRKTARGKIAQRVTEQAAEKADRLKSLRGTRRARRPRGQAMRSRKPPVAAAPGIVGAGAAVAVHTGAGAGLAARAAVECVGVESEVAGCLTKVQDEGGVRAMAVAVAASRGVAGIGGGPAWEGGGALGGGGGGVCAGAGGGEEEKGYRKRRR